MHKFVSLLDELGDMHLFPYQQQMLEDMEHGKTKRELLYSAIPWPNNTIPYRIDPKIVGKCVFVFVCLFVWLPALS